MRYTIRVIIGLLVIAFLIGTRFCAINEYITLANLKAHSIYLKQITEAHYLPAVLIFITLYVLKVLLLLPFSALMNMAGGFLFGAIPGTIYCNIGATLGATGSFFLVRYFIGDWIHERYGKQLERFNKAFRENGASFLLFIHFIPIIPFFLINFLAGMARVSFRTFLWTTSLGIIPGSFVYAFAGQQLSTIKSLRDIFSFNIIIAFVLLALFALFPLLLQKIRVPWLMYYRKARTIMNLSIKHRVWIVLGILTFIILGNLLGLRYPITLQSLQLHAQWLYIKVQEHYFVATVIYFILFTLATFLLIPITVILTLAAGYLFGMWYGGALALLGATLGSAGSFLVARYIAGDLIQKRYEKKLAGINYELERFGAWYIIMLELIPFTPYLVFDLLAGVTTIRFSTYVWATMVGLAPGTFIYTAAGEQLHNIYSVSDIISWPMIILLSLLALFALIPLLVYRVLSSRS